MPRLLEGVGGNVDARSEGTCSVMATKTTRRWSRVRSAHGIGATHDVHDLRDDPAEMRPGSITIFMPRSVHRAAALRIAAQKKRLP